MGVTTYRSGGAGVVTKCWESSTGTEAIKVSEKNTAGAHPTPADPAAARAGSKPDTLWGCSVSCGDGTGGLGLWGQPQSPRGRAGLQQAGTAQHSTAQRVVAFSSARELLFGSQTVQNGQTGQCSALSRTQTELPGGGSAQHPREMQPEGANKKIRTYHSTSKYTVFLQSTLPIRV